MRILNDLENERISIDQMGIIKAVSVLILVIIFERLGYLPKNILNLYSKEIGGAILYINFGIDIIVKYIAIVLLIRVYSEDSEEEHIKKVLNKKNFIYIVLMIIGFRMFYDNSLYNWVSKVPTPKFINEAFQELGRSPIILIISVAIIAPIYEEFIFRGIILKGMLKKYNPTVALVVSSLLFAIMHMNIRQGINAFLLGLIMGFIYLSTKSIYLSMFAHFLNNTIGILIAYLFKLIGGKYAIHIHVVFFIMGIIFLVVGYKWHKKNRRQAVLVADSELIEL